ncbi:MAG: hypothetical protein NXI10_01760 [bacterium]|nr:hypothetical protein [bacterium]
MPQKFSLDEYQLSFLKEERLKALYHDSLFKLFVPKKYGGLELNLASGVRVLIDAATIQGGYGWALNLGAGANWFSGFFSHEAAQELFTSKEAVIAGSGFVNGSYVQQGDQFSITGTWSRCSGAHHATFFSLKAKGENDTEKTFVVPRDLVTVARDDWAITGLRNASSYSISMQEAIIPARYAFEINEIQNPHAYAVHTIPFEIFARVCMSASFIGIVVCLMNRCTDHPLNQRALDFIENELKPLVLSSEASCLHCASLIDRSVASEEVETDNFEQITTELTRNNVALFEKVQTLFLQGGLPFVEEDTSVHWAYRDVLTAVQHQMVKF